MNERRLPDCRLERFPMRHARCVWVLREDDCCWLVLARDHGWLFGDCSAAFADAQWLSQNLAMPIRVREAS
jgi:hypothetical protein